jgi:hypothetical protein
MKKLISIALFTSFLSFIPFCSGKINLTQFRRELLIKRVVKLLRDDEKEIAANIILHAQEAKRKKKDNDSEWKQHIDAAEKIFTDSKESISPECKKLIVKELEKENFINLSEERRSLLEVCDDHKYNIGFTLQSTITAALTLRKMINIYEALDKGHTIKIAKIEGINQVFRVNHAESGTTTVLTNNEIVQHETTPNGTTNQRTQTIDDQKKCTWQSYGLKNPNRYGLAKGFTVVAGQQFNKELFPQYPAVQGIVGTLGLLAAWNEWNIPEVIDPNTIYFQLSPNVIYGIYNIAMLSRTIYSDCYKKNPLKELADEVLDGQIEDQVRRFELCESSQNNLSSQASRFNPSKILGDFPQGQHTSEEKDLNQKFEELKKQDMEENQA